MFRGHKNRWGVACIASDIIEMDIKTTFANTDKVDKVFGDVPIVVVDDIEINHAVISKQLRPYGLKPICVLGARRALKVLRLAREKNVNIPIVICDYHMAGMNGLEFAEELRRDSTIDGTQIIILTSMHLGGIVKQFNELNVHNILERPCSAREIIGAIKNYIPVMKKNPSQILPFLEKPQAPVKPREGNRVLAVDDDSVNLFVIKGFLEMTGYYVETAEDGLEAVNAFKSGTWDIVLMDISMPILDGVQATKFIREYEYGRGKTQTPIIAVTAHTSNSLRADYLEAGMNDIAVKPLRKLSFDAMMDKWCPLTQSKSGSISAFG